MVTVRVWVRVTVRLKVFLTRFTLYVLHVFVREVCKGLCRCLNFCEDLCFCI